MKALKKLYVANLDNKTEFYATNLKDFVTELEKLSHDNVRNYAYYVREFKKYSIIELQIESKKYILQEHHSAELRKNISPQL